MDRKNATALVIQQLLSTLKDAETGQRGYLITGEITYLEPYTQALARTDGEINEAMRLTVDDPLQQERIRRFSILSHKTFEELAQTIALRRDQGEDAARAVVATNVGDNIMAQLRMLTADLSAGSDPGIDRRIARGRTNLISVLSLGCGSILLCAGCALIAMHRNLRESEERFRLMVNFIPEMVWMADETGRIFWCNQRWYDYTGKTSADTEDWGRKSVRDPEAFAAVAQQLESSIAAGQPFHGESRLRDADGRFRVFLTRVMPWKDNNGNVSRWFGTHTHIY